MIHTSTDFFARDQFKGLLAAIEANGSEDSLTRLISHQQWETIAEFLQLFTLNGGQELIRQGSVDRSLYFVEEGTLTVHYQDVNSRIRLAVLGPGSALGEGSFFSHLPRNATVHAASPCKIWRLSAQRFQELSRRHPGPALALAMGLGSVISVRLQSQRKRTAVT